MELQKKFTFEAAHVLPKHPGKCSRLHGHSWVLTIFVAGRVHPDSGFVVDYSDISSVVKPIIEKLDHRFLGQYSRPLAETNKTFSNGLYANECVQGIPDDFYPTSENLCLWIADQIGEVFDEFITLGDQKLWTRRWSAIRIEETCTSACTLARDEWDAIRRFKANDEGAPVAPASAD